MLLQESNPHRDGVIQSNTKQSYCYHARVYYFPITAQLAVCHSSYTPKAHWCVIPYLMQAKLLNPASHRQALKMETNIFSACKVINIWILGVFAACQYATTNEAFQFLLIMYHHTCKSIINRCLILAHFHVSCQSLGTGRDSSTEKFVSYCC